MKERDNCISEQKIACSIVIKAKLSPAAQLDGPNRVDGGITTFVV